MDTKRSREGESFEGVSLSSTDPDGIITYVNRKFAEVSGYTKSELIGQNHNIVRHPDVPKALFKELWDTIKQGQEWTGVICNRKKSGEKYWVYTHIVPIVEAGEIKGYSAVRRCATELEIVEAEECYRQMHEKEMQRI